MSTSTQTPKQKRRKPVQLNSIALRDLRGMGFVAEVVEKRLPHCFITKDFIGCIDILAFRPGAGVLGIQVTTGSNASGGGNLAARRTKAGAEPLLRTWLNSGCRFELWAYRAVFKGTRRSFVLCREEMTVDDLTSDFTGDDAVGEVARA